MQRLQFTVIGMSIAILALTIGGLIASSAQAAFTLTTKECNGSSLIILCYESQEAKTLLELEGEEDFELAVKPTTFLGTLAESEVAISCAATEAEHSGSPDALVVQPKPLEANMLVTMMLRFVGCKLTGTLGEKCTTPSENTMLSLDGEPASDEDLVFKPETGTAFMTISIQQKSGCPATIIGGHSVTGTQLCTLASALVTLPDHQVECNPTSGLKFGENTAHFTFNSPASPATLDECWGAVETG